MLTLTEAAKRLGVAAATLRWQIRNGKLRAKKVGPIWTVSKREVERYARENRRFASDDLTAAWQAAWDALPGPTWSVNVRRWSDGRWSAWARDLADDRVPPIIRIGEGLSEAAALNDVARRLSTTMKVAPGL